MASVKIHKGSILDVDADVLVNPANSFLMHGGGLARIIAEAAIGPLHPKNSDQMVPDELGREWASMQHGNVAVGSAVLHPPGHLADLGFKGVIHTVGPIWGGGHYLEDELLIKAYMSSMALAASKGYTSIAMPAISAGIFGVPISFVAYAAAVVVARCHPPEDVTFALMDDKHIEAFETSLRRYGISAS